MSPHAFREPRERSGSTAEALERLAAVMAEQRRKDRDLDYARRSRAALVAQHGEHPREEWAARILLDLDARLAALGAKP
jgi:hypothetical protein